MQRFLEQFLRQALWVVCAFAFTFASCSSQPASVISHGTKPERVDYAFAFNVRDMRDVEILDYWLKTERPDYTFTPNFYHTKKGKEIIQAEGTNGRFAKPTMLYVKWRIKSTGQEYQDTVNVRQRLPKDIAGSTFTFLIDGAQLNVYLATRELRPKDWPIQGDILYKNRKVLLLYPDATTAPSSQQ